MARRRHYQVVVGAGQAPAPPAGNGLAPSTTLTPSSTLTPQDEEG